MAHIKPAPLPTHYKELDNLRIYRMSDNVPKQDDSGKWIVVIAAAFVAVCLLAIKFGVDR